MSRVSNILVSVETEDAARAEAFGTWLAGKAPGVDGSLIRIASGALREVTSYGGWKAPEWNLHAGVLNLADHEEIVDEFARTPWEYPEYAQLLLRDEDDDFFSLWMFRAGVLQRLTPAPRGVDADVYPQPSGRFRLRLGGVGDADFLTEMASAHVEAPAALIGAVSGAGFARRDPTEPAFVLVLDEVDAGDPDAWAWERVACGFLWAFEGSPEQEPQGGPRRVTAAVAVPEDLRSRGFTPRLIERLVSIARERGVRELRSTVRSSDTWMIEALLAQGFTVAAAAPAAPAAPDSAELTLRINAA